MTFSVKILCWPTFYRSRSVSLDEWEFFIYFLSPFLHSSIHYMLTRKFLSFFWWISTRLITKWNEKQTKCYDFQCGFVSLFSSHAFSCFICCYGCWSQIAFSKLTLGSRLDFSFATFVCEYLYLFKNDKLRQFFRNKFKNLFIRKNKV